MAQHGVISQELAAVLGKAAGLRNHWAFTASPSLDFSQVQLGLLVSF